MAENLKRVPQCRLRWIQLPYFGISLFLALYFYASNLYPGGIKTNPMTLGYSHLDNYWCDLLDAVSYSKINNPGRPFAILAGVVLPISLTPFWFFVPVLFSLRTWQRRLVRFCGCSAMVLAAFIYTSAHDSILNTASLLGFCAFTTIQLYVAREKKFLVAILSNLTFLSCMTNFLMWKTDFFIGWMPLVQRLAFLTLFSWVLLLNRQIELYFKSEVGL